MPPAPLSLVKQQNLKLFFHSLLPHTARPVRAQPFLMAPQFPGDPYRAIVSEFVGDTTQSLIPKTLILSGEPGTGKTHAALAIGEVAPCIIYVVSDPVASESKDWTDAALLALAQHLRFALPPISTVSANTARGNYDYATLVCMIEHLVRVTFMNSFISTAKAKQMDDKQIYIAWRNLNGASEAIKNASATLRGQLLFGLNPASSALPRLSDAVRRALAAAYGQHRPIFVFDEVQCEVLRSDHQLPRKGELDSRSAPDSRSPGDWDKHFRDLSYYIADYSLQLPTAEFPDPVRRTVEVCLTGTRIRAPDLLLGYDGRAMATGKWSSHPDSLRPRAPPLYTTSEDVLRMWERFLTPDAFEAVKKGTNLVTGPLRLSTSFLAHLFENIVVLESPVRAAEVGQRTLDALVAYHRTVWHTLLTV
eukprot:TRINITY_DN5_c1_g1_i7.p1 TRINITY_DN5_c1_g1~~TRINITY_DN5_c1_g1_i7.p1  ORF type:complete len:420 (+),score=48.82 TRINITY_DN5_c1_g1_i7:468-1727(+)